jgi:hypothetical protein
MYPLKFKHSNSDTRDYVYQNKTATIKDSADLREWDTPVDDQGKLGSCGSEAMVGAYELMVRKNYPDKFVPLSQLFVYYNTRILEETVFEDSGVTLREVLKSVKKYGICSEQLWLYDIEKFTQKPPEACYLDAQHRTVTNYQSLSTLEDILEALDAELPVLIGLEVFHGFMKASKENSMIPEPNNYEDALGGHAMFALGYSLANRQILAKNSFGKDWGDNGYCWLSFDYVKSYVFEKWIFDINNQIEILLEN